MKIQKWTLVSIPRSSWQRNGNQSRAGSLKIGKVEFTYQGEWDPSGEGNIRRRERKVCHLVPLFQDKDKSSALRQINVF